VQEAPSYVAECFWPDVDEDDLDALDRRIREAAAAGNDGVRYLGSILLREDEVVLCRFEGAAATVKEVAERAQIPFERILTSKEANT